MWRRWSRRWATRATHRKAPGSPTNGLGAGVIGEVRDVHVWSDRAGRLWKQGIGRPTDAPATPKTLDWNLWLGPIPERPYHPIYAPVGWRGWWDFGTGALGDMGCHIIDHPVWALNLGAPTSVEARTTLEGTQLGGNKTNFETYPLAAIITYQFPARGKLPPVTMTWYDGGLMPPTPAEMPAGQRLPDNGVLYVGSKGKLFHGSHGGMPQLLPGTLLEQARTVPKTMARSPGHYEEWVLACKGGPRRGQLRLLWPADRNRTARRAGVAPAGYAARMGLRKSQSEECSGAEPIHPHRISQRLDAMNRVALTRCHRPAGRHVVGCRCRQRPHRAGEARRLVAAVRRPDH